MREGTNVRAIAPRDVRCECTVDSTEPLTPTEPPTPGAAEEPAGASTNGAVVPLGPDGLPRPRRRRGSRGGRNRKRSSGPRPAGSSADGSSSQGSSTQGSSTHDDDADAERGAGREQRGHDWNDADADSGYTEDDVLVQAREDAGLIEPSAPEPAPAPAPISITGEITGIDRAAAEVEAVAEIETDRPTPVAAADRRQPSRATPGERGPGGRRGGGTRPADGESAAEGDGGPKKRRRRRGGRGRSRSGAGGAPNGAPGQSAGGAARPKAPAGGRPTYVEGSLAADAGFDETSVLDLLDEEQLEKRRGQMRKGRPTGRYAMVVRTNAAGVSQIAVLEGRNLIEHYVSEPEDETWSIDGNIYLGRVQNVLPGMEAAFIDIGTPKNGVLYQGDVAYDEGEMEGGEKPRIERVLRNGQAIIVQVTKNPIGHKGARLTQEVSLAGRFVVMVPAQPGTYGISKRLPDDERKRLRRILDKLRPDDAGLIVRTAAEGATEEELERDMRRLRRAVGADLRGWPSSRRRADSSTRSRRSSPG